MSYGVRWIGFAAGLVVCAGTTVGVMKTLIVPRRGWSLMPAFIGRNGFRIFHGIAVRFRSYDLADRLLGYLAPRVIIGILVSFLGAFVVGFALLLLPFADVTIGEALREAGSSVFTLGFVSTAQPAPTVLDIMGGATGMIFVALTIGYLPTLYAEVKHREVRVKQLEGWTGVPSWGPEILARFAPAGAVDKLPELYSSWDSWSARVADSHMKYPVLTHFRLPRSHNHWAIALLAVMDAAALEIALRPDAAHPRARLFLGQALTCLRSVACPMRRVELEADRLSALLDEAEFRKGVDRVTAAGFPAIRSTDDAWREFAALQAHYAPLACRLAYWTVAAPAPWSGDRAGFTDLVAWPDAPDEWLLVPHRAP